MIFLTQRFNRTLEGWKPGTSTPRICDMNRFNRTLEGWKLSLKEFFKNVIRGFNRTLEGWKHNVYGKDWINKLLFQSNLRGMETM